jgi:hypothetical protein
VHNTEDKTYWCQQALADEERFVRGLRYYGYDAIINPKKETDKYAPDLIVNGRLADLKHETAPLFTSGRYGVEPQYSYTFNRKDYIRYKNLYPDIDIFVWLEWKTTSMCGQVVQPMNTVWLITFDHLKDKIESGSVPLHTYKRRIDDKKRNAKDSYVFDIREFTHLHGKMPG